MNPDLELVQTRKDESFRAWMHDYPHTVAKWHFHPEYEVHVIRASTGKCFVGDYIGDFAPGNLVITGPNLPHNWICDGDADASSGVGVAADADTKPRIGSIASADASADASAGSAVVVPSRDCVLQFTRETAERMVFAFSELQPLLGLLDDASRGVQFPDALGIELMPMMIELATAQGPRRVVLLMALFERLIACTERRLLAGPVYDVSAQPHTTSTINQVLTYIQQHVSGAVRESDVAELAGMSVSTFTRFFRKQTGCTFTQFLQRLRINEACESLMCSNLSITDICYRVGFNNLSNFNRQFLAAKGMPPSRFRSLHQLNEVGLRERGGIAKVTEDSAQA
ncbi:AraC family transcriptional regulator [Pararobbsia silviterrae]|uniref:AraC family transcriptional regulator n=1 Tax=Pararobbsia silviterrae TaxID=1792498 RepID=A0A494XS63_9BURK|nr:AraC family transcriptional regulator [Pararobbsia silviterrae]RKP53477.1 AraC family transcriptional regulator [Pararobbsia silviterrae]